MAIRRYFYWAYIEIMVFFSYIFSASIYLMCHQISPFKCYMYYLTKAVNGGHDLSTLWSDKKRSSAFDEAHEYRIFTEDHHTMDYLMTSMK